MAGREAGGQCSRQLAGRQIGPGFGDLISNRAGSHMGPFLPPLNKRQCPRAQRWVWHVSWASWWLYSLSWHLLCVYSQSSRHEVMSKEGKHTIMTLPEGHCLLCASWEIEKGEKSPNRLCLGFRCGLGLLHAIARLHTVAS